MLHPLTDEIIMNLKQLNNLLQRFTSYKLVRQDDDKSWSSLPGNAVHRRAYTSSTDPCQDGNYLIGKYG